MKTTKLYIEQIGTTGDCFHSKGRYRLIADRDSYRKVSQIKERDALALIEKGDASWVEEMPEQLYYNHNPMQIEADGAYIGDHREWQRLVELPHQAVQMYFGPHTVLHNKEYAVCDRDYKYVYCLYNHDGAISMYRKETK